MCVPRIFYCVVRRTVEVRTVENLQLARKSLNLLNAFASSGDASAAGSCTEYDWELRLLLEERHR